MKFFSVPVILGLAGATVVGAAITHEERPRAGLKGSQSVFAAVEDKVKAEVEVLTLPDNRAGGIRIRPGAAVTKRLTKEWMRRKLLASVVEGSQGGMEFTLDGTGREYLGTCPRDDVDKAVVRFEEGGEDVIVQIEIDGATHFDKISMTSMEKQIHKTSAGGGLKHDAAKQKESDYVGDTILFKGVSG